MGVGQFVDLMGAWQKRGGGVFEVGGVIPKCTLWWFELSVHGTFR